MFHFMITATTKAFIASYLIASAALTPTPALPTKPASFNSSLWITKANKIRIAVEKSAVEPVTITLRTPGNQPADIFFRQLGRKQTKLALQLDVSDLADGVYELKIKSATGCIIRQVSIATPQPSEQVRSVQMP